MGRRTDLSDGERAKGLGRAGTEALQTDLAFLDFLVAVSGSEGTSVFAFSSCFWSRFPRAEK